MSGAGEILLIGTGGAMALAFVAAGAAAVVVLVAGAIGEVADRIGRKKRIEGEPRERRQG